MCIIYWQSDALYGVRICWGVHAALSMDGVRRETHGGPALGLQRHGLDWPFCQAPGWARGPRWMLFLRDILLLLGPWPNTPLLFRSCQRSVATLQSSGKRHGIPASCPGLCSPQPRSRKRKVGEGGRGRGRGRKPRKKEHARKSKSGEIFFSKYEVGPKNMK